MHGETDYFPKEVLSLNTHKIPKKKSLTATDDFLLPLIAPA